MSRLPLFIVQPPREDAWINWPAEAYLSMPQKHVMQDMADLRAGKLELARKSLDFPTLGARSISEKLADIDQVFGGVSSCGDSAYPIISCIRGSGPEELAALRDRKIAQQVIDQSV